MTKISVITVCLNAEEYIQKTVESVLQQESEDFEYIVIDGASTDRTIAKLEGYQSKFLRIISECDSGVYDALNKGIQLAIGEYIVILHAGDVLKSSLSLKKLSTTLTFLGQPDILLSSVAYKNYKAFGLNFDVILDATYFRSWMFKFGFMPPHTGMVIKRECFKIRGNYSLKYTIASDFDLCVRYLNSEYFKSCRTKDILTIMNGGGLSNSGRSSYKKISHEIIQILIENGYRYPRLILLRLPIKSLFRCIIKRSL